jgi:PAS domain S-box-containing protein
MDSEEYTVVIVDDKEMVTASLSGLLMLETDYNVLTFNSPSEALDALQSEEVNLVISDYLMPGEMNGVEFLLELKKLQPDVIRILLTAYADKENAIRAINEIALYQYVEKPWDNDALLLLIRNGLLLQKEIDERRRAEEALRESEEKYRVLFEESPAIISIVDRNAIIKDANRAFLEKFGYSKNEFIGRNAVDFVVPEQREKVSAQLESDFKGESTQEIDIDICARDGSIHTVLFSPGKALLYEGDRPTRLLVTGIDITERKRAEELARSQQQQLIQADKMASLGILVSGVAHEINNPNNFILLNAKIFSRAWNDVMPILQEYYEKHGDFALAGMPYTQAHERIGQLISGMFEGAQRIQKIVQGLKDFARQDTGDLDQSVDINEAVEAAILIVGNLIKKSTDRFSCEYASNLPRVRGNVQQLEQVIINLITNACHALQDTEKGLLISTSSSHPPRTRGPTGDSVVVEVRDEGIGISPENLKHIVDPFYTTKRDSGGTGLGLSISYNIVKAHGGDLNFTSEQGKGTTVILTLPALSEGL